MAPAIGWAYTSFDVACWPQGSRRRTSPNVSSDFCMPAANDFAPYRSCRRVLTSLSVTLCKTSPARICSWSILSAKLESRVSTSVAPNNFFPAYAIVNISSAFCGMSLSPFAARTRKVFTSSVVALTILSRLETPQPPQSLPSVCRILPAQSGPHSTRTHPCRQTPSGTLNSAPWLRCPSRHFLDHPPVFTKTDRARKSSSRLGTESIPTMRSEHSLFSLIHCMRGCSTMMYT